MPAADADAPARDDDAGFVVRTISRRPCVTCVATLLFAAIISAVGLVTGTLEVQTEGWETRGTPIANRQVPYSLYSESTFDDGTTNNAYLSEPNARRKLLSGTPDCGTGGQYDSESNSNMEDDNNFHLIFESKGGDLFTPQAFADMCKATESFMDHANGGGDGDDFGSLCERQSVCSSASDPPGTTSSDWSSGGTYKGTWQNWQIETSGSPSTYRRCSRAFSYPTYLYMKTAGASSCDDYLTNSALQTALTNLKTYLLACAPVKAADSEAACSGTSPVPWKSAALGEAFGLNGVTDLSLTRSIIPTNGNSDMIATWGLNTWEGGWTYSSSYFNVYYDTASSDVKDAYVDEQLFKDLALAVSAISIIIILMWVHMGSVLLTVGGIVQVLLAFPSAIFFTKTLCQLDFFPFLNFIGLFVIAGIGADDCFVMYDKFQQSKCRCVPGANATEVMKRAYWDSAWAMFLTSMTTAAAFYSNAIIPIAPIRVFAIFMGTMVIFDYLYDITIFAALLAWQHDVIVGYENTGKNTFGSWFLDFYGSIARFRANCKKGPPKTRDADDVIDSNRERRSVAEAMLADKVFPIIHTLRWFLVVALIGAFAGGMVGTLKLSTPRDSEVQLLPDDHMFTKFSFLRRSGFKSSTESQVWTKVLWGVTPSDNGDHFNPASRASIEWDTSFDLSPTANQNWLKTFCSDTKSNMANDNAAYCWFEYFETWLGSNSGTATGATFNTECGGATSIPVPQAYFYRCVKYYADQNPSVQMMSRPLSNAFYTSNGQTRMKIMAVQFATNVLWTAPTEDLEKVWQTWENYFAAKMATAPAGLKNGFQTSDAWAWMDTVAQMRDGAYIAAGTTLAIAAVTTMISTQNVIITLYSLLCILTILVVTVAGVVSMGWNLGFLEGICLVILIGLSVDYVVHIGHAYAHAARHEGVSRRECARSALSVMGFPVLGAAFTTLCAALALLQAVIVFFTKFGTIVVLSAVFSSIVSVVLFIGLLAAAGPVNGMGDVTRLCGRKALSKSKSVAY